MTDDELMRLYREGMRATPPGPDAPDPDRIRRVARGEATELERLEVLEAVMRSEELRREFDTFRALAPGAAAPRRQVGTWLALAAALLLSVLAGAQWWRGKERPEPWRGDRSWASIAPADGATVDPPLRFAWPARQGAHAYEFVLLAADGAVRAAATTGDTTFALPDSISLPAGVWRWNVTALREDGTREATAIRSFSVRP